MSANGDIYITISDTRGKSGGDGGGKPTPTKPKPDEEKTEQQKQYDYISHLALDFLKSKTKEVINTGIANIGNFTGNYQAQREIQSVISNVSKLVGIGMATIAGAKHGRIPGAIAGFVVGTASVMVSDTLSIISQNKQISNTNAEVEQIRTRAGLNPLNNGGRTG